MKRTIDKLRSQVRDQKYVISIHANQEMSDDQLSAVDVENAILTGKIGKRLTKDQRGTRYEVVGHACDDRSIAIVCRLLQSGWLTIITVYALDETNDETRPV